MKRQRLNGTPANSGTTGGASAGRGLEEVARKAPQSEKDMLANVVPLRHSLPPPPKRQRLADSAVADSAEKVQAPRRKPVPFTSAEDRVILRLYESLGNKWSLYEKDLSNRKARQVRNRITHLQHVALKDIEGPSLFDRYIVLDAAKALFFKRPGFWRMPDAHILSDLRLTLGTDWPVISARLGERHTMETFKRHYLEKHTAPRKGSVTSAPQLPSSERDGVPRQHSIPRGFGTAGVQASATGKQLGPESSPFSLPVVTKKVPLQPGQFPLPRAETFAPSAQVRSASPRPKDSELLSAGSTTAKELNFGSGLKGQFEKRGECHFYATVATESTLSDSDQLVKARRENLALHWASRQSSTLEKENVFKNASAPMESTGFDVHAFSPVVRALLRCGRASAWSASTQTELPSEMCCIRTESGQVVDSSDFDIAASALLTQTARIFGAQGPFEASSFFSLHEQAEKRISTLVGGGILTVLSAAVRHGETGKLCFLLLQFVQQTFDHLLAAGTNLQWAHLFANGFLGPLLRCSCTPATLVKELESLCIISLTKSSELMKNDCPLKFARGQEICMAVCDMYPEITQGLPMTTYKTLSESPMFAASEVMSLTQQDLDNLLIGSE